MHDLSQNLENHVSSMVDDGIIVEDLNIDTIKIKQTRQFALRYMKLMITLLVLVVLKTILIDRPLDIGKLIFYLSIVTLFALCLKIDHLQVVAPRIIPISIACLIYFAHSKYMVFYQKDLPNAGPGKIDFVEIAPMCKDPIPSYFNKVPPTGQWHLLNSSTLASSFTQVPNMLINYTISSLQGNTKVEGIFKNIRNSSGDSELIGQLLQCLCKQTYCKETNFEKLPDVNEILKNVIIFGAFFINHIYLDIFLTINPIDSIILNAVTGGLLSLNIFFNNGKELFSLHIIQI
ncbi:hypothetical protein FGO68_gene4243 [Halteria grandinella]|uniref:Uncharacterized protein n=1 Tax=Halteria grandinella TaxID=5974 RepID=A0A8J8T8N9_HALGN|nr:hypothetical protein FGO68_gene4243 [Halteria grandinella]